MNDVLLRIGESGAARRLLKSVGLPVPLPARLRRADGPWQAAPLAGHQLLLGSVSGAAVPGLAESLVESGATVRHLAQEQQLDGLLFDATELRGVEQLRLLYDFFQPLLASLRASGRVVLLARPVLEASSPASVAAQSALEGFVRSLAKEIGKKGATAQLVRVASGAERELVPVVRFLLSPRSAFISGQVLSVSAAPSGGADHPVTRVLQGKVALVTGAARGIGQATAQLLAGEGAHVVCLDRPADEQPLAAVAREIGGSTLLLDLSERTAPSAVAEHLLRSFGGVDVVVHNAGVTRDKTLQRMSAEQWDQAVDVNLGAVLRIDEALGPILRDGGREICLASIAGIAGTAGQTNYAAAKAGLIGYVRQRAARLAARGITVNAVAPGLIETRLTAAMPVLVREAGRRLSALAQGGQPRDVAEAVTFLASPGAAGINASVLRVCGGAFLGA